MKKIIIFFLFVLLQGMGIAQGSFISMETKTSTTLQENTLVVKVTVTNKGDEPAYSVQVVVEAHDKSASTPVKDVLKINESYEVETTFDMDIQMVGRYPLIVTVDYADLNQYPFSAISSSYFVYKEDVGPKIHGKIEGVGISKSGRLVLVMKNLLDTEKKIKVKLVVPRELSVTEPILEVELGSKSEREIRFDIKNFSALVGSSYQVFAVMRYDDDDKHCTVTIPGMIKIMERADFLKTYKWVFIGVGIALLVVFLVLQFGVRRIIMRNKA
jgi:hypothetical protein